MSKSFTPRKLLSDEFVERLWSHLPLTVYCDCEDEWSDAHEAYVAPDDCECDRKTIVCVRNALATVLGEPQVQYTDPRAAAIERRRKEASP
jgi:hypothetical protein